MTGSPRTSDSRLSRRQLLAQTGLGLGSLALADLLWSDATRGATAEVALPPRRPGAPAQAVIFLMQNGGPSQMDLFDPKPELNRLAGQVFRDKVEMFQTGSETNQLLGTPYQFARHGECGMELSEALPGIASVADDLCLIRSMRSEHNNHTEALVMLTSGKIFPGRPTLGSWVSYGLGSENENLPGYVVLRDPEGYPGTGATLWQSGWLPQTFRGTEFNTQGPPVLNLTPAASTTAEARQADLEFLSRINELHRRQYPDESVLEARIRNYELAARMQLATGDTLDLAGELEATKKCYGLDRPETTGYGARLLMARRLVEQGVRFVQVFPAAGNPWDSHTDIKGEIDKIAAKVDGPTAALIGDLKQRGLLESTIVVWTGEFGRLPVSQRSKGRDHNRNAFSLLVAGGGFRGGYAHGATDEVGYRAVEQVVTLPDLFATILHQLGLDHTRLTYRHHGRDESLTDVAVSKARVVHELLS